MAGPVGMPRFCTVIITLFMGLRYRGGRGSDMKLPPWRVLSGEQVATLRHEFRERQGRAAQDLLHVVGDEGGFVDRLGEHGEISVGEVGGETDADEALPYRVGRHLAVLQRTV